MKSSRQQQLRIGDIPHGPRIAIKSQTTDSTVNQDLMNLGPELTVSPKQHQKFTSQRNSITHRDLPKLKAASSSQYGRNTARLGALTGHDSYPASRGIATSLPNLVTPKTTGVEKKQSTKPSIKSILKSLNTSSSPTPILTTSNSVRDILEPFQQPSVQPMPLYSRPIISKKVQMSLPKYIKQRQKEEENPFLQLLARSKVTSMKSHVKSKVAQEIKSDQESQKSEGESYLSSMNQSAISELQQFTEDVIAKKKGLQKQAKKDADVSFRAPSTSSEISFTEVDYDPGDDQEDYATKIQKAIDSGLPKETAIKLRQKSKFADITANMVKKIPLKAIRITQQDQFCIPVHGTKVLKEALDRYKQNAVNRSNFKLLLKTKEMKRAFLYIFWIFVGFKFKSTAFGDHNHFYPLEISFPEKTLTSKMKYDMRNEDLALGKQRRINFIQYWRMKFQANILALKRDYAQYFLPATQELLPFILGEGIVLIFEKYVRFSKHVIAYCDPTCAQVFQVVFMEITGLKVDKCFVEKFRDKRLFSVEKMDDHVKEFLQNQAYFMRMQAIQNYKSSEVPIEKLEYKLDKMIGPKQLKDKANRAEKLAKPNKENLEWILEENCFSTDVMAACCLFPLPKTKFQRILEFNHLSSSLKKVSASQIQDDLFLPGISSSNTTDQYTYRSRSTLQPQPSTSRLSSHMSSSTSPAAAQKMTVFTEGGRHDYNQPLHVLESDRTSPMLRSVQSQQTLMNILSARGDGIKILEDNSLFKSVSTNSLEVKSCINNLVPVPSSGREVKLLYAEQETQKQKNAKLNSVIKTVLDDHAKKAKIAKNHIIRHQLKKLRTPECGEMAIQEQLEETDNASMESMFDKDVRMLRGIHDDVHKQKLAMDRQANKGLNLNSQKVLEEGTFEPEKIMASKPSRYKDPLELAEMLKESYPGKIAISEDIPLHPNKIRDKYAFQMDKLKRNRDKFIHQTKVITDYIQQSKDIREQKEYSLKKQTKEEILLENLEAQMASNSSVESKNGKRKSRRQPKQSTRLSKVVSLDTLNDYRRISRVDREQNISRATFIQRSGGIYLNKNDPSFMLPKKQKTTVTTAAAASSSATSKKSTPGVAEGRSKFLKGIQNQRHKTTMNKVNDQIIDQAKQFW